ncbi:hypothetical protein BSKO_04480 [Bryopsis sp. KO-2023]|nr:hypothetical protein BSKO_04480 [Bryopsis sp. KO-2023]
MSLVPHYRNAVVLRTAGTLLDVQFQCTATALTFLHRFFRAVPVGKYDDNMIVAACLFGAAKVEEASIRTADLLNVLHFLEHHPDDLDPNEVFPELHKPENRTKTNSQFLVGEKYYEAKDALIQMEQTVLRFIQFRVNTDHPHKYALSYCASLKASRNVVRSTACLLNDCMVYTSLILQVKPEVLGAGAVHLATILEEEPIESENWWEVLGFRIAEVEEVGHALMDMMVVVLANGRKQQ